MQGSLLHQICLQKPAICSESRCRQSLITGLANWLWSQLPSAYHVTLAHFSDDVPYPTVTVLMDAISSCNSIHDYHLQTLTDISLQNPNICTYIVTTMGSIHHKKYNNSGQISNWMPQKYINVPITPEERHNIHKRIDNTKTLRLVNNWVRL